MEERPGEKPSANLLIRGMYDQPGEKLLARCALHPAADEARACRATASAWHSG
jgi:hypothetical protein